MLDDTKVIARCAKMIIEFIRPQIRWAFGLTADQWTIVLLARFFSSCFGLRDLA